MFSAPITYEQHPEIFHDKEVYFSKLSENIRDCFSSCDEKSNEVPRFIKKSVPRTKKRACVGLNKIASAGARSVVDHHKQPHTVSLGFLTSCLLQSHAHGSLTLQCLYPLHRRAPLRALQSQRHQLPSMAPHPESSLQEARSRLC